MREVNGKLPWALSLLLALAVSIDGFSAGFSCGLRKLVIPFLSLLAISAFSATAVAASMLVGSGVAKLMPLRYLSYFGGVVLVLFGLSVVRQYFREGRADEPAEKTPRDGRPAEQKPRLVSLLHRPEEADLDRSGTLSIREALLLGAALAADAFAAGFGAALIDLPFVPTVLAVGLTKFILLPLGVALGRAALRGTALPHAPLWGGAILIIIGIINLF
ncbi:MAG: sporulation membrane protein YtaF [Dethiobacteria bacterium]